MIPKFFIPIFSLGFCILSSLGSGIPFGYFLWMIPMFFLCFLLLGFFSFGCAFRSCAFFFLTLFVSFLRMFSSSSFSASRVQVLVAGSFWTYPGPKERREKEENKSNHHLYLSQIYGALSEEEILEAGIGFLSQRQIFNQINGTPNAFCNDWLPP